MSKTRRQVYWIVIVLLAFCSQAQAQAQDVAKGLLGAGFLLDAERTRSHGVAAGAMIKALYGRMPDFNCQTAVLRFDGSFEEAARLIPAGSQANVDRDDSQIAGAGLGFFLALVENLEDHGLDPKWIERARTKVQEWGSTSYRRFSVTSGMDQMGELEGSSGEEIEIVSIELQSPLVDYGELEIVPGTWAVVTRANFAAPDEAFGEGAESEDDWGEEEVGSLEAEIDFPVFPQAQRIDPEETAASDLLGGQSYIVKQPVDMVSRFYLALEGRHCRVEDDSSMYYGDAEIRTLTVQCAGHPGEVQEGDEVTAISLVEAPSEVLSDLLGKNQGQWTIFSFDRWVEGDY